MTARAPQRTVARRLVGVLASPRAGKPLLLAILSGLLVAVWLVAGCNKLWGIDPYATVRAAVLVVEPRQEAPVRRGVAARPADSPVRAAGPERRTA